MARIQILELPEGAGDDRPPFVLVVDQCEPQRIMLGIGEGGTRKHDFWQVVADRIGARGVIVTPETVDIPANDATAYLGGGEVHNEVTVKPGDQDVRNAIAAEAEKVRAAREDRILDSRQALLDAQRLAQERTDPARDVEAPCPAWSREEEHDAHDWFAPVDGPARCPGWSRTGCDEGQPEPGPEPTAEERPRDVERIVQRVREAVATDKPTTPTEEPPDADLARLVLHATGIDVTHSAAPNYPSWLATACRMAIQLDNARDQLRRVHDQQKAALGRVLTVASTQLAEDECHPLVRDGYHDAMRAVLRAIDRDEKEGRPA